MLLTSLTEIERAVRSAWSAETCDPVDLDSWSSSNASCGQCTVTALVIQDLLGGELLIADVCHADGSPQGVHFWNRFAGGVEVDLTRDQFTAGETIGAPAPVPRAADTSKGRLAGQYQRLARSVSEALGR